MSSLNFNKKLISGFEIRDYFKIQNIYSTSDFLSDSFQNIIL